MPRLIDFVALMIDDAHVQQPRDGGISVKIVWGLDLNIGVLGAMAEMMGI